MSLTAPIRLRVMPRLKPINGVDGRVLNIVGGTNVEVDETDPSNPIVSVPDAIVAGDPEALPTDGFTGQVLTRDIGAPGGRKWSSIAAGVGDMLSTAYDPQGKGTDAFDMDNMSDGSSKVAMTVAERAKLTDIPDPDPAIAGKVLSISADGSSYSTKVGETYINLADYLALDGTDESSEFQAVIDANKGSTIVLPENKVLYAAGIYLNGSSYDGTYLDFRGTFKLKPAPAQFTNNGYGQVWSGIEVRDCAVIIDGLFDGDRTSQQNREQTICLTIAGADVVSRRGLFLKEVRGDGIYMIDKDYNTPSRSPTLKYKTIYGVNSAPDGRNLISVISRDLLQGGAIWSFNIGGIVNGAQMPGGVDIEPNIRDQSAGPIQISEIYVYGPGSTNVQFYGQRYTDVAHTTPATGRKQTNIYIGSITSINTSTSPTGSNGQDQFGNQTQSPYSCLKIEALEGVHIGYFYGEFINCYGDVVNIANCKNLYLKGVAKKSRQCIFGVNSPYLAACENLYIDLDVDDISRYGHMLGEVANSNIRGRLTNPSATYYSNRFAVLFNPSSGSAEFADSVAGHDIPPHANWTRTFRHTAGMTYPRSVIRGARTPASGTWAAEINRVGDVTILREDCLDVTSMAAMPTGGSWVAGQVVLNTGASTPGQPLFWLRLTTGSGNVADTDWKAHYPSGITPYRSFSVDTALALTDIGKTLLHPSADTTGRTITIPANASVAFPVGTIIPVINCNAAGSLTIAITTDTLRLAGAGTTGSRTLAANGEAVLRKLTATEWQISGTGLT